jgi:uncharacterized repeat protein (TIGR03843 family)
MDTNTDEEAIIHQLQEGKIEIQGEFLWGSNYTFLATLEFDGQARRVVYKPTRGERPLWDFPAASLSKREVAAYLVSKALGWNLTPPTVYRHKGPLGAGSLQLFIEHDPNYHYFTFSELDRQRLRPIVIYDLLINNADRKGSHILVDSQGKFWLIDHGVCFHVEDKLRTVIWDFVDEPIPDELCQDLIRLQTALGLNSNPVGELAMQLLQYLKPAEVRALARRADRLTTMGIFPSPDEYIHPYPWPEI